MPRAQTVKWTREHLLIALNLYHKLTFGQMHSRNPAIVALAEKMGRSANSMAMKLCNLASLDPALKMRGIKGLSGASELDRKMWSEFHENLAEAVPASEEAMQRIFDPTEVTEWEVLPAGDVRRRTAPIGDTERVANVKVRRGQAFFRDAVLNNFGGRCGVTGLSIRELLVASHILPWGKYEAERLNVRNGISLSRLHDAAFDVGLITFDAEFRLVLSKQIRRDVSQPIISSSFAAFEGRPLQIASDAVLPDERFLAVHRAEIFRN